MNRMRRFVFVFALMAGLGGLLYFLFLGPCYSVPILTYHDFGYSADKADPLMVSPERFQQQMAYLKEKNYNVISLDTLADGIKEGRAFPHNTVVITMDDGNRSNYTQAYPILERNGFPAIIFLITDRIQENNAKYLTWDQIRDMARHGISFGGHTKGHHALSSIVDKKVLWDEIAGNKEIIEKEIGAIKYFAYPLGAFTEEIKTLVKRAGYKAALTTNRGQDLSNKRDIYELHRISIRSGDSFLIFWGKLSGYYNLFRSARNSG